MNKWIYKRIANNSWVSHLHIVIPRLLFLGEKELENVRRKPL